MVKTKRADQLHSAADQHIVFLYGKSRFSRDKADIKEVKLFLFDYLLFEI